MKNSMKTYTWLLLVSAFVLSGCMSREQADARLAKGCAAGAELFLDEGLEIKEIKDSVFRDDPDLGSGYREVRIFVTESDGWYEGEKEYKCVFADSLSPFGIGHNATIYQLHVNDEIYGKVGNRIMGTFKDHLKLTETVEQALQ